MQIISRKFDGGGEKRWLARILSFDGNLLTLSAVFAFDVRHPQLGFIPQGTVSIEYFWLDKWYNVFRFLKPDGELRNFYCNINLPPIFDGYTLTYADLDLDLLVQPDYSWQLLDEEEFRENAAAFGYAPDICAQAYAAVEELKALCRARKFPFVHFL